MCTTNQLKNDHELSKTLDTGDEIQDFFLYFCKTFGKVWHSVLFVN